MYEKLSGVIVIPYYMRGYFLGRKGKRKRKSKEITKREYFRVKKERERETSTQIDLSLV